MIPQIILKPGLAIPRLIRGTWQMHERAGKLDEAALFAELLAGYDLGFTAIEASDSYAGVEETLGRFRSYLLQKRGKEALQNLRIHTRVTQSGAATLSSHDIAASIKRSLARLGLQQLPLVQLQWWNLALPGWREAAATLGRLQQQGVIADIGLTNFPTPQMQQLLQDGIPVLSNQVQISLLDPRAGNGLAQACQQSGVNLFGYGPLAGGFLSEAWLGQPDPGLEPKAEKPFGKVYRQLIERFGGWDWLQTLLQTLHRCAESRHTDIASIALAWSLRSSGVTALLVGMSSPQRAAIYAKAAHLGLDDRDIAAIAVILAQRGPISGDVADIERSEMLAAIQASYQGS
ncbi:aldo/keto reductase [Ferrovibrio sp.]|uniref:aldo/keto reductase n=1 Tax=Ferrovibrio sp. TaxID=1917215 RepID=UPI0025BE5319|nr:aldo/keto reductase [Ferrovibrio sp.]MBX3454647.1 aldo/keto reductase [Ferrovibrio sp.]